jgi:protein-tyrosine-phosphatase
VKRRVLFLCTGNSARSQLAEALLRNHAGEIFEVASAGTAPEGIDMRTLRVLQQFGINTAGLRSKPISEFRGQHFDYVITLCDKAHKECANFPNAGEVIAWDFADPKPKAGLVPFEITLRELNARIKAFTLVQARGETNAS